MGWGKELGPRPRCPVCKGTIRIQSAGLNWHCGVCGKSWRKAPLELERTKTYHLVCDPDGQVDFVMDLGGFKNHFQKVRQQMKRYEDQADMGQTVQELKAKLGNDARFDGPEMSL